MKKTVIAIAVCLTILLGGCGQEEQTTPYAPNNDLIVVGFSQVGAESVWRVANTESMRSALSEENGYELIYDDGRNEPENQIQAIRTFILQEVNYIVFSPQVETGWTTVLHEAKEAGIPVIVTDRYIEPEDEDLYTAYVGSDFHKEGERAAQWLEDLLEKQGRTKDIIRIVDIQGTLGSSAQIGRTAALEQAAKQHPNWQIVKQECGDFTRAKGEEVMSSILEQTRDIDVVYCENDDEALGAIDAMKKDRLTCNASSGVIVISFDATKPALDSCKKGEISLDVECNPLQGPYVDEIIKKLRSGQKVERFRYIDETQFDCFTITQEMINSRAY